MKSYFSSGSDAVDKMGQIRLSGDVIPKIWYQEIRTDKGKPYYLAVTILADIVYWYRPEEIRDEYSGHVIGWRKRFQYDMLQRSYGQLSFDTLHGNICRAEKLAGKTAEECIFAYDLPQGKHIEGRHALYVHFSGFNKEAEFTEIRFR